jgi:hypothetical protein
MAMTLLGLNRKKVPVQERAGMVLLDLSEARGGGGA